MGHTEIQFHYPSAGLTFLFFGGGYFGLVFSHSYCCARLKRFHAGHGILRCLPLIYLSLFSYFFNGTTPADENTISFVPIDQRDEEVFL